MLAFSSPPSGKNPGGTESSGKAGAVGHGCMAKLCHHSFAMNVMTAFPILDTYSWSMS